MALKSQNYHWNSKPRLDFQPFWECSCLSSSQLRLDQWLDHWSVAFVRDVTSGFYANDHARRKMAEFVAPPKIKPFGKDVFDVGMFWIVQGKAYKRTGSYFKATRNRSQQASRYERYLYNDCRESRSKQNLSKSKSSILGPIELSTETRNHKPTLLLRPASVSRPLRQTRAFPCQFSMSVLPLCAAWLNVDFQRK